MAGKDGESPGGGAETAGLRAKGAGAAALAASPDPAADSLPAAAPAPGSSRPPGAEGLAAAAVAAGTRGLPPVELWNPPFCGEIDMRIARDGSWHYQGSPIARERMVRLFSTILKREGDAYFLVTPVEKVKIRVEDVPFVAVDFRVEGAGAAQGLLFTTNVGDEALAGPAHPLRFAREAAGGLVPYILIRRGLEARIDRKSLYRLVDLGSVELLDGIAWFGLRSAGVFFAMVPADALGGVEAG